MSDQVEQVDQVAQVDKVDQLLNPEINKMVLGTRESEKITVYPLTYYDQKKIGEQVVKYISTATNKKNEETLDIEYLGKLLVVLEENLPVLIGKCTDKKEEEFMSAATLGQITDFLTIIVEVNFINPIKKGTELFVNMGNMYGASQLLPSSVETTDTKSKTSRSRTKKVASQPNK